MKQISKLLIAVLTLSLMSCGGSDDSATDGPTGLDNKGIGPITSVELSDIDHAMVSAGEATFNSKCTACHTMDSKVIGPALKGVLDRRSPEWVMNMMLNTDEMLKKDGDAKKLLKEYNNIPMTDLGLSEAQAREVLDFLRANP